MQNRQAQHEKLERGAIGVAGGSRRATERTCALTRATKPVSEMIRFVLAPDETVVPDVKCKLPGRGVWITASRSAIEEAVRRNLFKREFQQVVRCSAGLAAETERLLEHAALDALAIAGKAGQVAVGFARVEATIVRGKAKALLHATDGGADGKRKLNAVLGATLDTALDGNKERTGEGADEVNIIEEFSGAQLDLALGCPNVVHAALLGGPGSEAFLARVRRLQRFSNRTINQGVERACSLSESA